MKKIDFKKLEKIINSDDCFIVCGHENPDPDSICSMIAVEFLLTTLGKKSYCINSDATPSNLISLDYKNIIKSLENGDKIPGNIEDYSLLVVDTNTVSNIGKIYHKIYDKVKSIYIIDHHSKIEKTDTDDFFIRGDFSSTCEILFTFFEYLKLDIPKEVCDAVYTGILFDTGSFHYPKTSGNTFHIAEKILSKGTKPNDIYMMLFEQESIEYLKALSEVLSTLALYHKNQIALLSLTSTILNNTGAKYDECSSIINIPLRSKNIKAVIYCKENKNGVKRISMRSKGNVDVVTKATFYNGGGHKNAAGFKLTEKTGDYEIVIPKILDYLKKEINKNG